MTSPTRLRPASPRTEGYLPFDPHVEPSAGARSPLFTGGTAGAALFVLCTILDGCDGEVARLKFRESRFGYHLDLVLDNVVYVAVFAGLAAVGSSILLLWIPLEPWLAALLWGGSGLVAAGLATFFWFQRRGKMSAVFHAVCGFFAGERGRRWVEKNITDLDERLKAYHARHGWDLVASMGLHVLGFCCGMGQAAFFLWLVRGEVTLFEGAGIWLLATWFDMASVLVPAGVGIQELSRFLAFQLLGLPRASGVSYAILLRVEQFCMTALGFACYGYEVRRGGARATAPALGVESTRG